MPLPITAIEAEGLGGGVCEFPWVNVTGVVFDGRFTVAECEIFVPCVSGRCLSLGG